MVKLVEMAMPRKEGVEYKYRECCYGLCSQNGKVLLVYSEKDKNYSVPGGGMERGETLIDALKREMKEEAGYELDSSKHVLDILTRGRNSSGIYIERLAHMFLIQVNEDSKQTPTEDWHKVVFVTKEEAIELVASPWQKNAIREYL